jgi:hypothetical protein
VTHIESIAEAEDRRIEWINQCCRQVDPRDLTHCTIMEYRHRPLFWQFSCRGVVISSFEITLPTIGQP